MNTIGSKSVLQIMNSDVAKVGRIEDFESIVQVEVVSMRKCLFSRLKFSLQTTQLLEPICKFIFVSHSHR
jgi:hypothetical protein